MNRKWTALILAAVMLVCALAGCAAPATGAAQSASGDAAQAEAAGNGESAKAAGTAGGERKEIHFWFWGAATNYQEHFKKCLQDAYNNSQDEYTLVMEFRNTVDKDIPVALAADAAPDIVYASGPSYVSTYAQEGKVISLNKYAEQYGWKDRMQTLLYDACCIDGELYSMPNSMTIDGLFYNKELFAEKGWEVPKTLEEMEAVMDAAAADGLYAAAAGNKGWRPCNDNFSGVMVTHFLSPKNMYNCLTGADKFTNTDMVAAVARTKDWYDKGYLSGDDYTNLNSQECMQLIADKRAAFIFAPSLYFQFAGLAFTDDTVDQLGFAPMPASYTDENVYSVSVPCNFSISATTPYADECAKILDMMLTENFLVEMTKGWPGYWAIPLKTISVDTSELGGMAKVFIEAVKEAAPSIDAGRFGFHPTTFFPPITQEKWRDIDSVWQGVMTPEEFCATIDAAITEEIAEGVVAPLSEPSV